MRICTLLWIACVFAAGCASNDRESPAGDRGVVELRIDSTSLVAAGVTRVTLDADGATRDLVFNPDTSTFDGALILTAGTHTVVARAFAGDSLVGQSEPIQVVIATGAVTRALLKILDLTGQTTSYGPIIDALVFPTTAEVGSPVTFALSAVAPDGSPLSYAWSSDCPDSAFSTPSSATTSWSKPTEGTCQIQVATTSGGFTVHRSFAIAVFPRGAQSGALDASGTLISAPVLSVSFSTLHCAVFSGGDASCAEAIASPTITQYTVAVLSWGSGFFGTSEISDNCGGLFTPEQESGDSQFGLWLPPADGRVCILTARAVNNEGAIAVLAPAILVHPGTPPMTPPPVISAQFTGTACLFDSTNPMQPVDCGTIPANSSQFLNVNLTWGNGTPGPGTFSDDCGEVMFPISPGTISFGLGWTMPNEPGRTCNTMIHIRNAQGAESTASALYHLQ